MTDIGGSKEAEPGSERGSYLLHLVEGEGRKMQQKTHYEREPEINK